MGMNPELEFDRVITTDRTLEDIPLRLEFLEKMREDRFRRLDFAEPFDDDFTIVDDSPVIVWRNGGNFLQETEDQLQNPIETCPH